MSFHTDHSLAHLGEPFTQPASPTPTANPQWLAFNDELAQQLSLPAQYFATDEGLAIFSGNQVPSWAHPVAHAYAGHQFGHFVPQLGDGRALLLAEIITPSQERFDLQLKGAGKTVFSRRGDGKAPLGSVLREYLVSEAMHRLGVPSTRALAATFTGDIVQREEAQWGAVLARVAKSHLRVGSFEYLSAKDDTVALRTLADYVINRHYPKCKSAPSPYLALLAAVIEAQSSLIAKWMSLGFIHGVMNTDNMSVCGETIDYGPCAFMDSFNPQQVYSFIDQTGRYAWANQPRMGQWNLARLANCLLPLLSDDAKEAHALAQHALNQFKPQNEAAFLQEMAAKLGLLQPTDADEALIGQYLQLLATHQVDYSQSFRLLSQTLRGDHRLAKAFDNHQQYFDWIDAWQARLKLQNTDFESIAKQMESKNPAIIARNHQVERAIQEANQGDLSHFHRLHRALQTPFHISDENLDLTEPPQPEERIKNTFCGT